MRERVQRDEWCLAFDVTVRSDRLGRENRYGTANGVRGVGNAIGYYEYRASLDSRGSQFNIMMELYGNTRYIAHIPVGRKVWRY